MLIKKIKCVSTNGLDVLTVYAAERNPCSVEDEYDLRLHRLHAAGPLSVRLSFPPEPWYFHPGSFERISPDLLGNLSQVLHGGQNGRPLLRGDEGVCFSGRFRHVKSVPNRSSLEKRQKAGGFSFQNLVLHLSYAHFLFAGVCAMGALGRQWVCAANDAADLRADYLLLLRRVHCLVWGPVYPVVADIESYTRTLCPKSFSAKT